MEEISIEAWIEAVSAIVGAASLFAIFWQLRLSRRQRDFASMLEFHGAIREIASLEANAMNGKGLEQRIQQIWLNQIHMMFIGNRDGLYSSAQWSAFEADIRDHFEKKKTRDHWKAKSELYPDDFRSFISGNVLKSR